MAPPPLTLGAISASPTQRATFADHQLTLTPSAPEHRIIRATVCSVSAPAEHLRRISVEAPEFVDFQLTGPDEFFGLFIPPHRGTPLCLPEETSGTNIRAVVAAMPDDQRPSLRWYTIRTADPARGRITFDVVTHGVVDPTAVHNGPGLTWVLDARIGDDVGIWTCHGLWHRGCNSQTLIADPSSAPSARAILEYAEAFAPEQLHEMHLLVIAESYRDLEPFLIADWEHKLGTLELIFSPATEFADTTVSFLRQLDHVHHPATQSRYVWVAGEGTLCKEVRRYAITQWGLPSDAVQWCPYWFLGRARP
ncbi:SIP domain-containing protein [Corynebacterium sp. 4HC-13]|uniref:siderophore-interacting protein n=1 Tax=Corynebacterium anserum TaxID=2684406 RepID=UPI00163B0AAE|nr:siderophore-interacting protein [Corynebacterium anserum]MBC2682243.1 SIP domain-containing protein [Corynebacterium anserum]